MMKAHILFFALFAIVAVDNIAQTRNVQFVYDNAGNRIGRAIVLASAPKTRGEVGDSINSEIYTDVFVEYQLHVYPNPTHGELKIELQGLPQDESYYLLISNTSGMIIFERNCANNPTVVDLTDSPIGIYVMRIQYKSYIKDYKIIRL